MNADDVVDAPKSSAQNSSAQQISEQTSSAQKSSAQDALLCDTLLDALRDAACDLRPLQGERVRERIPLEQVERELARVLHIELARLLVRARDLSLRDAATGPETRALRLALQEDARESIDIARACGVRVPRAVLRLVEGDHSTWPCTSRLERWARRLDPDVDGLPSADATQVR